MAYRLGAQSRAELRGVHPDLVRVVERAIEITHQDFSVHDGLRTLEEQKRYVASGVSQTLNSKHRPQADGFGHAVDLVPFINGKMRWEWEPIHVIAAAVWQAARELSVAVRWGGAWIDMADIKAGKKVFTDGPHFELVR